MILERFVLTASNADVLSGSRLDSAPEEGVITVFAASTQADGTLSVAPPGQETVIRNQPILLRANGEIRQQDDAGLLVLVTQGGHLLLDYTEVTAATAVIEVVYQTFSEAGID